MLTGRETFKDMIKALILDLLGAVSLSVCVTMFVVPNKIAPGGVSGIAVMLNYLFGLPVGMTGLVLNAPLLLIAYRKLGKYFLYQTLRSLLVYTVVVDTFFSHPPVYVGDPLLAALFGGVFGGLATGFIFQHGSTGGGTDIVTRLMQKRYPYISVGQMVVGINAAIMLVAAMVYQNFESALYGLVMTFTSGRVADAILYGADMGKYAMIVTDRPDEMAKQIIALLHRGATILHGTGAYKMEERSVLLCVVRKQEFFRLKGIIREVDPNAFVIVSDAAQILGKGFKSIDAADA